MDKNTVLLVDDEEYVIKSLNRALRKEPYRILSASGGEEALDILEREQVQVVLTDLGMPEMDGMTLLGKIQESHQDVIRLILSGNSEADTILDAINRGNIYRYLVKPWTDLELKIVLRQAIGLYNLREEKRSLLSQLEEHNRLLEQKVEERTRQLLKAESMAMVGKHASQLVHNLNNSLSNIFGVFYLVSEGISEELIDVPELREVCEDGIICAEKMHEIISGILDHSRDSDRFDNVNMDINRIINEEHTFFEMNKDYKYRIHKKLVLQEGLPRVYGNPSQIKQIVGNLIKNAIDAMEHQDEKKLTITTATEDEKVLIEVTDSGCGIDPGDLTHIFETGFTTKPVGKGTGLGLASVKSMVEAYHGSIHVASQKGEGTTFRVLLPAVKP